MTQQELPILMQGEMVRATERGDKTETRRITGLGRANECPDKARVVYSYGWRIWTDAGEFRVRCPYGVPGTRLWLRESTFRACDGTMAYAADRAVVLRPDGQQVVWTSTRNTLPSILMRREYCRTMLDVLDIDCERLQDITPYGALMEGISLPEVPNATRPLPFPEGFDKFTKQKQNEWIDGAARTMYFARCADADDHVKAFQALWDSINAAPKAVLVNKKIDHYVSYPWENIFDVREHRGSVGAMLRGVWNEGNRRKFPLPSCSLQPRQLRYHLSTDLFHT